MSSSQTFDASKLSPASFGDSQIQERRARGSSTSSIELCAIALTPSQMREHLGPPEIKHDYPQDSTHRRHSSVSAQQSYFMR